jgi:S-adenosylmethionine hydrolase
MGAESRYGKTPSGVINPIEWEEHAEVAGVAAKKVFAIDQSGNLINPATSDIQSQAIDKTHLLLQQIRDSISMRPDYVEASNSQLVSVTGSVGTTVASGTITQVTTVLGQTNLGGFSADMMVENNMFQDWGLSIRSLLI